MDELESLRLYVAELMAQIDMKDKQIGFLQKIIAEYVSNPKPRDPDVRVEMN